MGTGFLELLYKGALAIELARREIGFAAEVPCQVEYPGHALRGNYRMDFVCFESVVLEIKATPAPHLADHAQLLSYPASSRLRLGLLLNFGAPR
jgi:GxxExxY protein